MTKEQRQDALKLHGGYDSTPHGVHHYGFAKGELVVFASGNGVGKSIFGRCSSSSTEVFRTKHVGVRYFSLGHWHGDFDKMDLATQQSVEKVEVNGKIFIQEKE